MSNRGKKAAPGRTAFELRHVWETERGVCPLCRFVATSLEHSIDSLFYENVNDPPTRDAIHKAGGFCRYHARLISRQADALGTAIILNDVLTNDLRDIDGGKFDNPTRASNPLNFLLQEKPPEVNVRDDIQCPPCPICNTEAMLEDMAVNAFQEALRDSEAMDTFSRSDGLCVPHFRLVFQRANDDAVWARVLETEKRVLKDLTGQLSELARKHDYRFKDEPRGEEMKSWRRALSTTSGWIKD